ncbi:MAG: glycoside hydrolase domain-containing protein [Candidatus Acidiferrales bacterium]
MNIASARRTAFQFVLVLAIAALATKPLPAQTAATTELPPRTYLGFDSNQYPGDSSLSELRNTFAFTGYWLNPPPGEKENPWLGKRATVAAHDFGFLVLFNGRLEAELKRAPDPSTVGQQDADRAVAAAAHEGFRRGTVIFLDQEEGGRLPDDQMAYVLGWIKGVTQAGFKAGVYSSGIPVKDGRNKTITTAENIREEATGADISFFVYNDACPPSPGCAYRAPAPAESGTPFATTWQFAQSPRRKQYTSHCATTYSKDGNCHPANASTAALAGALLDLDSATSPDPSHTR